jgi:hypothetical protein
MTGKVRPVADWKIPFLNDSKFMKSRHFKSPEAFVYRGLFVEIIMSKMHVFQFKISRISEVD